MDFLVKPILKLNPFEEPPLLRFGGDRARSLSIYEIRSTVEIVEKWALPVPRDWIDEFNATVTRDDLADKVSDNDLVDFFSRAVAPYADELGFIKNQEHSKDLLASGFISFSGCLLIYWSQFGLGPVTNSHLPSDVYEWRKYIFDYTLLYMYVDHYLDDNKLAKSGKVEMMQKMLILIDNPDAASPPPGMNGLVEAYKRLLKISPKAKKEFQQLFYTEIVGVMYQSIPGHTRHEYLRICELKGGRTSRGLQALIGAEHTLEVYRIGVCTQLIDDIADVYDDKRDGVHTIATYDLDHFGKLDYLLAYTVERLAGLQTPSVKVAMMELLTYVVGRLPCFSSVLKRRLIDSIHFRSAQGVDVQAMVTAWIKNVILTRIATL